jgi:segregation and condensation protein B
MSEHPDRLAALEAVLFIHGEPLGRKKLAQILGAAPEEVDALLLEYEATLADAGRGLALIKDHEKVQLVTKPQFHHILETFVKEELKEDLTPAALETLAIIAYFGPIARSRIDYQRGVNSMFILRSLLLRGLVERFPDPAHANSFLYQASFDLWKHLGITKKEDLPEFGKFQELLTQFESQTP